MATDDIWATLELTPAEANNLRVRSHLMRKITKQIKSWDLLQKDAAEKMGMTQPRLNNLLKGKIDKFSLDALVLLLKPAGLEIVITVDGEVI